MKEEIIENIKKLIAKNDIPNVILILNDQLKGNNRIEELRLIEGRFNEIVRRERIGLLSQEEAMRLRVGINDSILSLIRQKDKQLKTSKTNRYFFLLLFFVLVVVLALSMRNFFISDEPKEIVIGDENTIIPYEHELFLNQNQLILLQLQFEENMKPNQILALERGYYDSLRIAAIKQNTANMASNSIQLEPNLSSDEYFRIGISQMEIKDYNNAIANFTKSITQNPNFSLSYSERGFAKRHIGDYQGALEDYNKSIRLDSLNSNAFINRSVLYLLLGDYDKSIEDGLKSVSLGKSLHKAYNNLGNSYLKKREYDLAVQSFNKAIKSDSTYSNPYHGIGIINLINKDTILACKFFTKSYNLGLLEAKDILEKNCKKKTE